MAAAVRWSLLVFLSLLLSSLLDLGISSDEADPDEDDEDEDFPESVYTLKDGTFDDFLKGHEPWWNSMRHGVDIARNWSQNTTRQQMLFEWREPRRFLPRWMPLWRKL